MKYPVLLPLFLLSGLLAGCAGTVVSQPSAPSGSGETATTPAATKTGLSVAATCADSKDGSAKTEVTMVAVTVDENGIIRSCIIDQLETALDFDTTGALLTDPDTEFPTKNQLGSAYGMGAVSPIGREWDQQAAALAEYVVGMTADQVAAIPVNEEGRPTGADLMSSATISISPFLEGIVQAVNNAE